MILNRKIALFPEEEGKEGEEKPEGEEELE